MRFGNSKGVGTAVRPLRRDGYAGVVLDVSYILRCQAVAEWELTCEKLLKDGRYKKDLPKKPKRPLKPKQTQLDSDNDDDGEEIEEDEADQD